MERYCERQPRFAGVISQEELAYLRLFDHLAVLAFENTTNGSPNLAARLGIYGVMQVYHILSMQAATEGLPEEARQAYIRDWLVNHGLVDTSSQEAINEGFCRITQGYELNRAYWDRELGGNRRGTRTLQDLMREIGCIKD